jgi:Ni,Fe-hydrogenase I cytochrome b subunit
MKNPLQPENIDFVIANIIILMVITGVIAFGNAMYYGKAGQVQAI